MGFARALTPALVLALLPHAGSPRVGLADPPSRVGRLSYIAGVVSLRPGGEDDWADATLNYPLSTGDNLWTDDDSRAEITLGSTAIRLARYTAFGVLTLDDNVAQVRLSQGSLQVRLRSLDENDTFEIDTPNGAVSLLRPGNYTVDVDSTGDTTIVTVRRGEAEVTAQGSAFSVRTDQAATLVGTDYPSYDFHEPLPPDEWEDWCASRDRRADDSRSVEYVSRDVPGYEDLDEYGDWRMTPAYGAVWVPRHMVGGWAPYRYGHWAWVDPWGWTWIDDAPWGFAPFHYGRWVYWNGGWGWVPGHMATVRPVYAPALVVFVGGARSGPSLFIRLGGGGGGIGWFPLAPGEVYVPGYHVSDTYARRINVTNVNITNINVTNVDVTRVRYRNRDVAGGGGVTVVGRETFEGGRPVGRNVVVVTRTRLATAPVVGATAPIAPTRESIFTRRGVGPVRRPPEDVGRRTVVVRNTPAPPPLPFDVRQKALQEHPGRPLDDATVGALRARTPARRAEPVRSATPPPADAGAPAPGPRLRPARPGIPEAQPAPRNEEGRGRRAEPQERPAPVERPTPEQPVPPAERERPGDRRGQGQERRGPPQRQEPPPAAQPAPAPSPMPQPAPQPAERPGRPPVERPARPEPAQPPAQQPPPAQPAVPPPAQPTERGRRPVERPAPVQPPSTQEPARPPVERPAPVQPPAAQPSERPAPAAAPARGEKKQSPEGGRRRPQPKAKGDSTNSKRDTTE